MRFLSLSFVLLSSVTAYAQQDVGRVLPAGQPVHLVAFGDFGTGSPNQAKVADAIARRHAMEPFNLGITMGDNFYRCGVRGVEDKKWQTRWEKFYTPLGIKFYASLGNHDYGHPPIICPQGGGSPDAEVAYTERSESWRMPARYYTFTAGPVRFIAVDTEGWSQKQLVWIKETLARTANEPDIRWRVVYGHHPIMTSGVHLNERRIGRLRRELLPVLIENHVDLYICGHDHDLERLKADGMDFMIVGGGGAKLRNFHEKRDASVFQDVTFGFAELTITENEIDGRFLDTNLRPLEQQPLHRVNGTLAGE